MTTTAIPNDREVNRQPYVPAGSLTALFKALDPEILVDGPAGTGKTFAICHLLHAIASSRPSCRLLMCRKTLTALTATAQVTYKDKVAPGNAEFFGGSPLEPASWRYDNGSVIVVGGMDNPSKILSSEYDLIYVNEATELTEEDWETLTTRLRNGVLRHPRIIGDCNPTYDRHWLLRRVLRGATRRIRSTHADNPSLTDDYLTQLSTLTGSRYQRLYLGEWVGMENAIYPQMRSELIAEIPEHTRWTGKALTGVDYGSTPTHPSAVTTFMQSSTGVWWVRECWAETGGNTDHIADAVSAQRVKYHTRGVFTDPTIKAFADVMGWRTCSIAEGSRKARIGMVTELLDGNALMFDKYGSGIQELYDEMTMYRYETKETDTEIKDVIVRFEEDRVASLEYAVEGSKTMGELPTSVMIRRKQGVAPVRKGARSGWNYHG